MCPVCNKPTVAFELEGIEVDHCLECGGTWLDEGELEQIGELAGTDVGPLTKALHEAKGDKHGKRRCFRCPSKLQLVHIGEVELDRCPYGHGLWFDRGEIRKVVSAFEKGEEGAVARFFGEMFRSELKSEKT